MIYYKWLDFINTILGRVVRNKKGLVCGKNLIVRGKPIIDIRDGAKITIGDNVTLNSQNFGYHFNIGSPVKLFANVNSDAEIIIGDNTRIHGTCIHAKKRVQIGKNCLIAGNCQIFDCNSHPISMDDPSKRKDLVAEPKPVIIEDNVWITANCIILPGVTIGEGSIIGAGSVVNQNIPPKSLAMGSPIQILKTWGEEKK